MAFTFDQIFAADQSNPENVASNGIVTIYAPGDVNKTPVAISAPDGSPLPNPIPVNVHGFASAFMHDTLDRVAWSAGDLSGFFTSYEGMKSVAVGAELAAAAAAAAAASSAAEAKAASNLIGEPGIREDDLNPGTYFILASSLIREDPANPGFYLIGA